MPPCCGVFARVETRDSSLDRVIFLDVDGVLHSLYGDDLFNHSCCEELKRIVCVTGASLVLSSTWRLDSSKFSILEEEFSQRGLPRIAEKTASEDVDVGRAEEICRWLDAHPGVSQWLAIDDIDLEAAGPFSSRFRGHFVHTCHQAGLSPQGTEKAIRILSERGVSVQLSCRLTFSPEENDCFRKLICKSNRAQPSPGDVTTAVLLKCVYSQSVDLASLDLSQRCLASGSPFIRWQVGRQSHPQAFENIVPNEALRNCISRVHAEFLCDKAGVNLKKLSKSPLFLNGVPIENDDQVQVSNGTFISFFGQGDNIPATIFASFQVILIPMDPDQLKEPPECMGLSTTAESPRLLMNIASLPAHAVLESVGQLSLVCVGTEIGNNNTVANKPRTMATKLPRTVLCFSQNGQCYVGRQHQAGFFEDALGITSEHLAAICPSHLSILPVRGRAGSIELRNLGQEPVLISDQGVLEAGQQRYIHLPVGIKLLPPSSRGHEAMEQTFIIHLRVELELLFAQPAQGT